MEQLQQKTTLSLIRQRKQMELSNGAVSSKIIRKHGMTSAERMRAYRQRLREKQTIKPSQAVSEVQQNKSGNNDSVQSYVKPTMRAESSTITVKKPRLTSAERMRAYRQRLREKQLKINTMIIKVPEGDFDNKNSEQPCVKPDISTDSSTTIQKRRLTSAEKMRAYRQRLREKQMTKISVTVLGVPQDDFVSNDSKQLYARPITSTDCSTINKKPRLTSAEKMRVYRQRLRVKQMIQNSSILEIQLHSFENTTSEELNNIQTTNTDTYNIMSNSKSKLSETITACEPSNPASCSSCSLVSTTDICSSSNSSVTFRETVDIKSEIDENS